MSSPLRFGTDVEFAAVRNYLNASGYTLETVAARVHETLPYEFTQLRPGPGDAALQDALDLLIRLFLRGETFAPAQMLRLVPVDVLSAMQGLGLLADYPKSPGRVYAPVALCPVEGLFVVSDRWSAPDEADFKLAADAVYPALTLNTQAFLGMLMRAPCEALLDLCSGTGVAALLAASSFASHAVAGDVEPRCVEFADFNRRLNGLSNVSMVQSDVYGSVEGQTFDRILAHPPSVPVLRPKWVYHDGGADGEQITRRIVQGLPQFLRPGGIFQCKTLGSDRQRPLEQRIREWLGDAQAEFDLLVVVWSRFDPGKFASSVVLKDGSPQDLATWKKLFEEWKVEALLDASVMLVRHAEARAPLDVRRTCSPRSRAAEADWLYRFQLVSGLPQVHEALLRSRPRAADGMKFLVTHVIEDGELRAAAARCTVEYPFNVDVKIDRWMPLLLAACDGSRSGMELYDSMRRQGHIPADTPPQKFAALLAAFVSSGFVVVEEFAPPAALKATAASS
jgi:methylase of polypeptide subunit release factors